MKYVRLIALSGVLLFSLGLVTASLQVAQAASKKLDRYPQNEPAYPISGAPAAAAGKLIAGTGKFVSDSGVNGSDSAYEIDVTTNISHEIFNKRPFSGATFDPATANVLFTSSGPYADGSNLYSWSSKTMTYTLLGAVKTITGEVRIDGLAISGGILYGVHEITDAKGVSGLYEINRTTLSATLLFTFTNLAVGGIDADPITGKIYGVDDIRLALIEIGLDGTITDIADYPSGEFDIDGLAIDRDHNAYLITDQPGRIYVYNLISGTYGTSLRAPWTSEDYFSAGAFISDPQISVDPASLSSTQFPDQIKSINLTIGNSGFAALQWTIQEDDSRANVCTSPTDIPWLSLSQPSGSTPIGTNSVTGAVFDSTGLMDGVYTGTLCITSNDATTPLMKVPLTMTVDMNPFGVDLSAAQAAAGNPGEMVTYTLQITNTSKTVTDTFDLSASGIWPASLSTSYLSLGSGESTSFTVEVSIPVGASNGAEDVTTVTATSRGGTGASAMTRLTTTSLFMRKVYIPTLLR